MLPLSAFQTKTCSADFSIDEIQLGQLMQLCVQVTDKEGCPVNVLDATAVADCSSSSSSSSTPSLSSSSSSSTGSLSSSSSSSSSGIPSDVGGTPLPTGWNAVYRIKQMYTSIEVIAYYMTVVDASKGLFSVTMSPGDIKSPGILLAEVAIFDDQNRMRLIDRRYLKVIPTLQTQNFGQIMPSDVRMALWDYCPEQNTLLDDYEFSEDMIIHMIRRPLDLWNEIPPDIHYAMPQNFRYREHWLRCTVGYLLVAAGRLMRRNNLQYNAGGLSVDDDAGGEGYISEGERLIEEYKRWAHNKKVELNVSRGYGTLGSSY